MGCQVLHLDSHPQANLLRSSLEQLAANTTKTTNKLLAACDNRAFQRRLELIEHSFKL